MERQPTNEVFKVNSIKDVEKLYEKYDRKTHIIYNCCVCGKEYKGTIRYTLAKKTLVCKQCNIGKTKVEKHGSRTYNNSEKAKKTCEKKYGVVSPFQLDWVRQKNAELCKTEDRRKKVSEALNSHTPDYWKNLQKEKEKRIIEKWGSLSNFYKSIKEKSEKTCLEKYGVRNAGALNAEKEYVSLQKYFYEGRFFDSSYELKYFIFLRDNNMKFEFHNGDYFTFKDNAGNSHRYYPDFLVNNQYIEIKGEFWWDEEKQVLIDRYGNPNFEKTECMKSNGVIVKTSKDLKKEFEYVDKTYGKTFVKQFKYRKEHK